MDIALVSACLLGLKCRYDAHHRLSEEIVRILRSGAVLVPVCPEQLGGLPTPRPKNRIEGGDGGDVLRGRAFVLDENGKDRTENFVRGANETLRLAKLLGASVAYLKTGSPSCGSKRTDEDGRVSEIEGVTTALLKEAGIRIVPIEGNR